MRMDVLKSIPQFSVERQTFSGIQCFQCKDDNNHQNPCKYFQMLSQVKPKKGFIFFKLRISAQDKYQDITTYIWITCTY